VNLADEMLDHLFRDFEIGDDAVAHRTDRFDVARRAAQHHLRVIADGANGFLSAASRDRGDDGRLVQNDAFAFDVDQRVRGPKINRHIARQCAE